MFFLQGEQQREMEGLLDSVRHLTRFTFKEHFKCRLCLFKIFEML
jgi:hypothetical protein